MPEETVQKRSPFVERVPKLENSKWAGMPPAEGAKLVTDILAGGKPAVAGIVDGLQEVDDGSDWKERLLIHQLATQTSVPERAKERGMLADVLIAQSRSDRPATVRSFLLQQLRFIADASHNSRLAPLLEDEDPLVLDAVTAVMVSVGEESRKPLEKAMDGADGHAKTAIQHALRQLSS